MKRRFFYHYNKIKKLLTVHHNKTCYLVNNIKCDVKTETYWRKVQPRIIVRGFCKKLKIKNKVAYIS